MGYLWVIEREKYVLFQQLGTSWTRDEIFLAQVEKCTRIQNFV